MIAHTSKFKDNESLFSYFLRGKVDHPLEILLDQEKYDFRIRPNYDGEPINIPYIIGFCCFATLDIAMLIQQVIKGTSFSNTVTTGPRPQLESMKKKN